MAVAVGDEVVHQSHPGRFTVTAVEPPPHINVYSNIITIRASDGREMRVLDTTVRVLAPRKAAAEADDAGGDAPEAAKAD
jgi:hypothetical protein